MFPPRPGAGLGAVCKSWVREAALGEGEPQNRGARHTASRQLDSRQFL